MLEGYTRLRRIGRFAPDRRGDPVQIARPGRAARVNCCTGNFAKCQNPVMGRQPTPQTPDANNRRHSRTVVRRRHVRGPRGPTCTSRSGAKSTSAAGPGSSLHPWSSKPEMVQAREAPGTAGLERQHVPREATGDAARTGSAGAWSSPCRTTRAHQTAGAGRVAVPAEVTRGAGRLDPSCRVSVQSAGALSTARHYSAGTSRLVVGHAGAGRVPDAAPPATGDPVTVLTEEIRPIPAPILMDDQDLGRGQGVGLST